MNRDNNPPKRLATFADFFNIVPEAKKAKDASRAIQPSVVESHATEIVNNTTKITDDGDVSKYLLKGFQSPDFVKPRSNLVERSLGLLGGTTSENPANDALQPLDQNFVTHEDLADHYKIFIQRVQQQLSTVGGGGEVWFRNLNDVDRSTFGPGKHLAYNPNTKMFFFEDVNTLDLTTDRLVAGDAEAVLTSNGVLTVPGNIVPDSSEVYTLGTSTKKWADVWIGPHTLNIEDTVTGSNTALTVTNGVLQINGANQLQVGQLKFVENTIQSTTSDTDIEIGETSDSADLVLNRNVIIAEGKTLIGDGITFNTSAGISVSPGQMAWNSPDGTLDIGLSYDGVVLQVGQETHYVVRNATGNTLPNGTSVYCSGVTAGSGRMEASKFVADGSISPIQYLGLCSMDISNGVNGVVTYFGYVRGLDTRGTADTAISTGTDPGGWTEGTKLYAHPTVAGKLTSVEPTLPEQSICVAVVITRNQNSGVLFVRPTQTIPTSAGDLDNSISLSTLQTVTAASTDFADFQARIAALP